ncbi:TPA: hypothetical protein ACQJWO_005973, partial [Klebsiella pneumoniae]
LTGDDEQIDLRQRSSAEGKVTRGFNRFLDQLEQLVAEVLSTTGLLQGTGRSLNQTTEQLRGGASRQLAEIAESASAMQAMGHSIDELARHARQAAEASHQASADSQQLERLARDLGELGARFRVS